MGRVVGSVIAGYVVMFVVVFVLSTAAWIVLGSNGAFRPHRWEPSALWLVVNILVGLGAGVAGGWACAAIAKGDTRATKGLIGLIVVLGLLFAIPVLTGGSVDPGSRPDTVEMMEAMTKIRMPVWIALLNPVLGAVGVWMGARLKSPAP